MLICIMQIQKKDKENITFIKDRKIFKRQCIGADELKKTMFLHNDLFTTL